MSRFTTRRGPATFVAGLFFLFAAVSSAVADQGQQNQLQRGSMSQQALQMPPGSPVVSISAMIPQELRVGQEFQYEIQVENVSDNIAVHDLVIEQQSSQTLQIEKSQVEQQGQQQGGQQGSSQSQSEQGPSQSQQGQQGQQGQSQSQQGQSQSQSQQGQQRSEQGQQGQQQGQQGQQQGAQSSQSSSSQGSQSHGQSNRWTISVLRPGETTTIQVTAVAEKEGQANACLVVKSYHPSLCIPTKVVKPELELVKKAPDVANLCEEIEVEYYVKNTGTGDAGQFTIRDPLPQGLETIEGEKELKFDVDGLQPNDVRKFVASLRATQSGEFSSRAVADLQEGGETHSNKATTRVRKADLAVQMQGPQVQYINQPVSYTVLVANKGDAPAPDTTLSVRFPASAQIVRVGDIQQAQASKVGESQSGSGQTPTAAQQQGQQSQQSQQSQPGQQGQQQSQQGQQSQQQGQQGQESQQQGRQGQQSQQGQQGQQAQQGQQQTQLDQREWRLGTLKPGQAVKVSLTLRFSEAKTIEPRAIAQFVCDTDTGREKSDIRAVAMQQTELIALPDLMLVVVDNQGTVPQGEQVIYTIVVENQGEASDENVQINAELPEGLEFVEAEGPTDLQSKGNQVAFAPIKQLNPDQRAVYKVTAKAVGEGEVYFRTKLTSKGLNRSATVEEPTQLFARTARADGSQ